MTSKEAVLELICEAKSVNIDEGRICFLRNIIEKDLEVLEILKSCIEEKKDGDYITFDFSLCWYNKDKDNFEIYRKIKDWLENE